jgi:ATP-independent RNA helicase DbpA
MKFSKYALSPRVLATLPGLGFHKPTKVQEKVIPYFLQYFNLVVEAPTGTGKTAAYGLPLISQLDVQKKNTQALIMVPSRELAIQVIKALNSFYEGDDLKIGGVYGGTTMAESEAVVRSGAQIVVAVPGRLKDIMSTVKFDFFWKDIKYFIMDEGDKLLEGGFLKDFEAIRQHLRKRLQICFFSATISEDAEKTVKEMIKLVKVIRLRPKEVLKNIKFHSISVKEGQRTAFLAGLIAQRKIKNALIFCGRREEVQTITGFLRNCGWNAESYYGSLEQNERNNILNRFKEGHISFLVASDLAARGLDILDLPNVINIAIPKKYDYYLHRIGRTGRAGRKGNVYNFLRSSVDAVYLKKYHKEIDLPVRSIKIDPANRDQLKVTEEEKWNKFHFSRGKRDKIRKGDIVGFLLAQTDLEASEIGTITIYDSYSIVDMPTQAFKKLEENKDALKIKGKTLKVRKYSFDEQEKRARAVKKLLKDRR